jgi:hypothetical protein
MPTILDLAYDGNYVGRVNKTVHIHIFTYKGNVYWYYPNRDEVVEGNYVCS